MKNMKSYPLADMLISLSLEEIPLNLWVLLQQKHKYKTQVYSPKPEIKSNLYFNQQWHSYDSFNNSFYFQVIVW